MTDRIAHQVVHAVAAIFRPTADEDFQIGAAKPSTAGGSDGAVQPLRVLFRSSNWLGDAVMSIPAVRAIKRARPDAHIAVLAHAKLEELWRLVPEVGEVIPIPRTAGLLKTVGLLRKLPAFDVSILFPNSARSALEVFLAGVPVRAGYRGHLRARLLTRIIPGFPANQPPSPQVDVFLRLAGECGANIADPGLRASLGAGHGPGAEGVAAICPGAEYGPAKRWRPERFASCAKRLTERHGFRWVIVGTGRERALCEQTARLIGDTGVAESLAGATTLAQLVERLHSCHLLLTNDTGTMHLAGLLGTPLVAVFGSTEPALTAPLGSSHRIVRRHVECSPCFLRKCPIDFRCMNEVTEDMVVSAAEQLLETPREAEGRAPRIVTNP